ncbi:MAG TPA: hypothetical protein VFQ44_29095 [Streptosporangiaceae bacterium]|nr:hypothetical protein [Streptosporangiaceae bacterium]
MNDRRAAGQELQSQIVAAARKGQLRMRSTVKNMTSAAQHIRPQLANLPRPTLNLSSLPGQAQLREKASRAPEFANKLHSRLPSTLQSRVPTPDQVKSSAQQFAGHARTVQRNVVSQVRGVATPLAHQAASRLGQMGAPAGKSETTTRVSQVTVSKSDPGKGSKTTGSTAAPKSTTSAKSATSSKSGTKPASSSSSSAKQSPSKPADS